MGCCCVYGQLQVTPSLLPPRAALLVVSLLVYTGLSASWAAQLEAPDEQERWLKTGHMFQRATRLDEKYLSGDDENYAQLDVIWGLKGIDRSDYDPYYPVQLLPTLGTAREGEGRAEVRASAAFL